MAMSMVKAFNPRMMTKLVGYRFGQGHFDSLNNYVQGALEEYHFSARILSGNRFSQFDEGVALQTTPSGNRVSKFLSVYIPMVYGDITIGDKFKHNGEYYNILGMLDESVYSFRGFLCELVNDWNPSEGKYGV